MSERKKAGRKPLPPDKRRVPISGRVAPAIYATARQKAENLGLTTNTEILDAALNLFASSGLQKSEDFSESVDKND